MKGLRELVDLFESEVGNQREEEQVGDWLLDRSKLQAFDRAIFFAGDTPSIEDPSG